MTAATACLTSLTVLNDNSIWQEIQEVVAIALSHPAAVNHLEIGASRVLIQGTGYYVRSELRSLDGIASFIVVAVERCPGQPTYVAEELRRVFRLTPAEVAVALLLGERKSNREIVAELKVGEHTARRHTEKVLNKLGLHQRSEVRLTLQRLAERASRC